MRLSLQIPFDGTEVHVQGSSVPQGTAQVDHIASKLMTKKGALST